MILRGRVWKFGDNINTDLILPGHAVMRPVAEQPQYAFEATRPDWAQQVRKGDIILGGRNFGTGSGRPAARILTQLGITAVVAETITGLFYRNCVNYGLPPIPCPGILAAFEEGDDAEVDIPNGKIRNLRTGATLSGEAIPETLFEIMNAGGVFPLLEKEGLIEPVGDH
jgi:3-isopropylmalate/(R)-2-methylmalate dehydratase small subunit